MVTDDDVRRLCKEFIETELVRDETITSETPLLSGGVISSFDLVSLVAFVERKFGVKIPNAKVTREYMDSVDQIVVLVRSLDDGRPLEAARPEKRGAEVARDEPSGGAPARAHPLLFALLALTLAVGFDRWIHHLRSVAPAPSTDPTPILAEPLFEKAIGMHELAQKPGPEDGKRIVFFGHSGVMGMNLQKIGAPAFPELVGRRIREDGFHARTFNLAYWFAASFFKDAELLEALSEQRFDLLVICFDSTYFDPFSSNKHLERPGPVVDNRHLFKRFAERTSLHAPSGGSLDADPELERELDHAGPPRSRLLRVARTMDETTATWQWLADARSASGLLGLGQHLTEQLLSTYTETSVHILGGPEAPMRWHLDGVYRGISGGADVPFVPDAATVATLEGIIDLARSRGVEVVLVQNPTPLLPGPPAARPPWTAAGWQKYDRIIARVRRMKNVPVIDLHNLVPPGGYNDSPAHWVPSEHERIAQALAPALERFLSDQAR